MIESNSSTISAVLIQVPARVMDNTDSRGNSNVGIIDALGAVEGLAL